MKIHHLPSRILQYEGNEYLFFSGTSYLGMGHQVAFREALAEGISQYGTIFSASRNNNLQLAIYEEAENFIAHWTGSEAALTVTSGLLAGQLVVQSLGKQDFIYAPSTHPALWYNDAPPQYQFKNYADFSDKIVEIVSKQKIPTVICSNAIDPLKCETYNFDWIMQLPDNKNITLVFDDSHGIGTTYTEGGGFMRELIEMGVKTKFQNIKIIVIASMAKALGIPGGVILGESKMIENIRKNPLFVGASPIVPAYLYAFLYSQNVYKIAQKTLLNNIAFFKKSLENRDIPLTYFNFLPNYPVFHTADNSLSDFLLSQKIMISSFAYPNPNSPPITRIILSALHTEGDIETLVSKIKLITNN